MNKIRSSLKYCSGIKPSVMASKILQSQVTNPGHTEPGVLVQFRAWLDFLSKKSSKRPPSFCESGLLPHLLFTPLGSHLSCDTESTLDLFRISFLRSFFLHISWLFLSPIRNAMKLQFMENSFKAFSKSILKNLKSA